MFESLFKYFSNVLCIFLYNMLLLNNLHFFLNLMYQNHTFSQFLMVQKYTFSDFLQRNNNTFSFQGAIICLNMEETGRGAGDNPRHALLFIN